MLSEKELLKPIPKCTIKWVNWKKIPIKENREKLINTDTLNKTKVKVFPIYFVNKINDAVNYCLLRETLVEKIDNISRKIPDGYKLLLLDGWRPQKVQQNLFDHYKSILMGKNLNWDDKKIDYETQLYAAKPTSDILSPSPHFTGGAIDLTLEFDGHFLDMGTSHDDSSPLSKTSAFESMNNINDERINMVVKNRRILYNLMVSEGFSNYSNEWWHFDYGNQLWGLATKNKAIYGGINFLL